VLAPTVPSTRCSGRCSTAWTMQRRMAICRHATLRTDSKESRSPLALFLFHRPGATAFVRWLCFRYPSRSQVSAGASVFAECDAHTRHLSPAPPIEQRMRHPTMRAPTLNSSRRTGGKRDCSLASSGTPAIVSRAGTVRVDSCADTSDALCRMCTCSSAIYLPTATTTP
jgi:hypothetical protein